MIICFFSFTLSLGWMTWTRFLMINQLCIPVINPMWSPSVLFTSNFFYNFSPWWNWAILLLPHSVSILVWNQDYELGTVPSFPNLWKIGRVRLELLFYKCLIELNLVKKLSEPSGLFAGRCLITSSIYSKVI